MAKSSWNPLMDRELMREHKPMKKPSYSSAKRSAERKAEQKHKKRYGEKAHTQQRPALPHERSFTEAMASDGGVELEHVTISVGAPCEHCVENASLRKESDEKSAARRRALRRAVAEGDLRLADVDLRHVAGCLPKQSNGRMLEAATWSWYISLLIQLGYVDAKSGRTMEAKALAEARKAMRISNARGLDDGDRNEVDVGEMQQHPMTATIDFRNPKTHILGLPIPPEFSEIHRKFAKLEEKDAERLRRRQKVPTNFKKKPPRLGEVLLLDHDGTGARTRFVIVTGMRKQNKGFIVTGNLKVSWSGKPKPVVENAFPETCRVRRDSKALMERRREANVALIESFEWGMASGVMLDQVSLLIQQTQDARKQRRLEKQAEEAENRQEDAKPTKSKKTKNKSSKRFK